jgi:hypothetical protein
MIGQIRAEQILDAALYDFLFCCSDRHAQNIFIDENASIQLIDNDLLLGGAQKGRFADGACTPSSLFLPSNMESWRVRNSPSRLGHLGRARAPLPHPNAWLIGTPERPDQHVRGLRWGASALIASQPDDGSRSLTVLVRRARCPPH